LWKVFSFPPRHLLRSAEFSSAPSQLVNGRSIRPERGLTFAIFTLSVSSRTPYPSRFDIHSSLHIHAPAKGRADSGKMFGISVSRRFTVLSCDQGQPRASACRIIAAEKSTLLFSPSSILFPARPVVSRELLDDRKSLAGPFFLF